MIKPFIIGVSGGSASGKTTLLRLLREKFKEKNLVILSQDNYYYPLEKQARDEQGEINFDIPEAIDLDSLLSDLISLQHGIPVKRMEYTFNNPLANSRDLELYPAPVILVEGLFIFHFKEISAQFDLKVFIESNEEIQLSRRLNRDKGERGLSEEAILYQWHNHVIPCYRKYLLPYRKEADIIMRNDTTFDKGLEGILSAIKEKIQKRS